VGSSGVGVNVGVGVKVGVAVGVFVAVAVAVGVGVWVDVGVAVGVSVGVGVGVEVAVGLGVAVFVGVKVGVLKPTILAMTLRPVSVSGVCCKFPVRQYAALSNSATNGKIASATHRDGNLLRNESSLRSGSSPQKIPQLPETVKCIGRQVCRQAAASAPGIVRNICPDAAPANNEMPSPSITASPEPGRLRRC
jgi:hypothetical protein